MAADLPYDEYPADSPIAYVRSLIPDMEMLDDPLDPTAEPSYLFDDATLNRFLAFARGNSPKRAAADACVALAGSELLILKKITTEDLMTDGPNVAKEHRLRAVDLRKQADDDDEGLEDNSGIFTAPFVPMPAPFRPGRSTSRFARGGW